MTDIEFTQEDLTPSGLEKIRLAAQEHFGLYHLEIVAWPEVVMIAEANFGSWQDFAGHRGTDFSGVTGGDDDG